MYFLPNGFEPKSREFLLVSIQMTTYAFNHKRKLFRFDLNRRLFLLSIKLKKKNKNDTKEWKSLRKN